MDGASKRALYFGCHRRLGHFLYDTDRRSCWPEHIAGFPWTIGDLDTGLLKNGRHPDCYDGKVFWTCGGNPLWIALFWWDNSVDTRGASNSGFYVEGFGHQPDNICDAVDAGNALKYAASVWPEVIARQRQPLVLQP